MMMVSMMMLGMVACGAESDNNGTSDNTDKDTYKVGIIQFVDDASLNQIESNIEKELDAKAQELGVNVLSEEEFEEILRG